MNRSRATRSTALWWLMPLLIVLLCVAIYARQTVPRHPAIGEPAPEMNLVELSDDLGYQPVASTDAQVVLLHFWGTWCGPCMMEYPELSAMASEFEQDSRFCFVPVSCEGRPETLESLWTSTANYFANEQINSPVFADPRGITRRSAAERLDQPALFYPTSILIDAEGTIAGVWQGYTPQSVSQIEVEVRRLLAK